MLRWFKQLAMRGCARELDEHGVAESMRLYFSTDQFQLMVDHWDRMFRRAPVPKSIVVDDEDTQTNPIPRRRRSVADDLLKFLSSCELAEVSSDEILGATGIEIKNTMRGLRKNESFLQSCDTLGWQLVPGREKGKKSKFVQTR